MTTDTTYWETAEQNRSNNLSFDQLVQDISDLGISLSGSDKNELREFYLGGAEAINNRFSPDQYFRRLEYATGQLLNQIRYAGIKEINNFNSFRDFLRSLCPLDPFC
jgi:hypothetical protein